jgi:hypothetical protein
MAAKVRPTCVQRLVPHFAPKPFAVEKAWSSGTAAQHLREWQLEEEVAKQLVPRNPRQQLDPPRKRRSESISRRTDEAFEWKDNSQFTDDRAKVLRFFPSDFSSKLTPFDKEAAKGSDTHRGKGQCGRSLWGYRTE